MKAALRKAEARSLDQLDAELPRALDAVTAADAQGWFRHAGYRSHRTAIGSKLDFARPVPDPVR